MRHPDPPPFWSSHLVSVQKCKGGLHAAIVRDGRRSQIRQRRNQHMHLLAASRGIPRQSLLPLCRTRLTARLPAARSPLLSNGNHRYRSTLRVAAATGADIMGRDKPEVPAQSDKLSAADFHIYNRCAEHMNHFHNNFRSSWKLLYGTASSGKKPLGMTIRQFLDTGEQFLHHLEMHHSIEEQYIFPVWAERMPAFRKELELLTQHKQIHKGMDVMGEYLKKVKSGEEEMRWEELKRIMDGFGDVLWSHLDDEVEQLGAENMRKYWSKEEMGRMPM